MGRAELAGRAEEAKSQTNATIDNCILPWPTSVRRRAMAALASPTRAVPALLPALQHQQLAVLQVSPHCRQLAAPWLAQQPWRQRWRPGRRAPLPRFTAAAALSRPSVEDRLAAALDTPASKELAAELAAAVAFIEVRCSAGGEAASSRAGIQTVSVCPPSTHNQPVSKVHSSQASLTTCTSTLPACMPCRAPAHPSTWRFCWLRRRAGCRPTSASECTLLLLVLLLQCGCIVAVPCTCHGAMLAPLHPVWLKL